MKTENNRVSCFLCHHHCRISEGEFGFCNVRENKAGSLFTHFTENLSPPMWIRSRKNRFTIFYRAHPPIPLPLSAAIFAADFARTGKYPKLEKRRTWDCYPGRQRLRRSFLWPTGHGFKEHILHIHGTYNLFRICLRNRPAGKKCWVVQCVCNQRLHDKGNDRNDRSPS